MFDTRGMSSSSHAVIADLRARMQSIEGHAVRWPMSTHPVLTGLLELRSGGTYEVAGPSLAMLLMAGPSAAGAWCAVVGVPQFGVESAQELGVEPERLVMVPEVAPGEMVAVLAALIDVVDVVLTAPVPVTTGEAARLVARMRERGCLLITWGSWPRPDEQVGWSDIQWQGVGQGHGHLQARQATLEVRRGDRVTGTRRVWFPDGDLAIRAVDPVPVLRSIP